MSNNFTRLTTYLFLKILMTGFMLYILANLFKIDPLTYRDFQYYVNNPVGRGPNIGFRYLINYLNIKNTNSYFSMSLAFLLNTFIDIMWLLVVGKQLNKKQLNFFIIVLALHPYAATYTLKFSSIIFAKLAVLYFFYQMINSSTPKRHFTVPSSIFWIVILLIRNSNIFILIPLLISAYRMKPLFLITTIVFVSGSIYYLSIGYLVGLKLNDWPWNFSYIENLTSSDNVVYLFLIFISARLLLLFGAREKLFTEGIEAFLIPGLPIVELAIYTTLGLVQIIGLYAAVKFFLHRYSYFSLVPYLPLVLCLVTVSHARYLLPYLPVCILGLALIFGKQNDP